MRKLILIIISISITNIIFCQNVESENASDMAIIKSGFKQFSAWFKEMHLNTYFKLDKIIDLETNSQYLAEFTNEIYEVAGHITLEYDSISNEAQKEERENALRSLMFDGRPEELSWINTRYLPRFIIVLKPKINSSQLRLVEKRYLEKNGISLWTRIFKKLSFVTNHPSNSFFIKLLIGCTGTNIYEIEGTAKRYGLECAAAIFGTEVTDIFGSFANPIVDDNFFDDHRIVNDFKEFIEDYYKNTEANLEYLMSEDNLVEMIIRGLRSEVIKENNDWEKIQIFFIASFTSEKSTIQFLVDGSISSGLGNYPPDTSFTTSMEPTYFLNLNNYTKLMATNFKEFLSEKYQR